MTITNEDNMLLMARYPDNYFDLAIVDPPYGIGINHNMGRRKGDKHSGHKKVKWDNEIPTTEYFEELMRVSKNQIIWGGNYFPLPLTNNWIFWDKMMPKGLSFSEGEMAWTSLKINIRTHHLRHHGFINSDTKKIHPTQKPVSLYEWVLMNYAEKGFKILDTHLGSGSIAIACHNLGYNLTACELDTEYYNAALKRLKQHQAQLTIF